MSWVYIRTESGALFTVGFYDTAGGWHSDGDYSDREQAAARVHYLNGGSTEAISRSVVFHGQKNLGEEVLIPLPKQPRPKIKGGEGGKTKAKSTHGGRTARGTR